LAASLGGPSRCSPLDYDQRLSRSRIEVNGASLVGGVESNAWRECAPSGGCMEDEEAECG
jgi:hypothetical protein